MDNDENQELEQDEVQTFDEGMDAAFDELDGSESESPEVTETPEAQEEQPNEEVTPEVDDHEQFKADLIADGKEKTAQRFDKLLTDNKELVQKNEELVEKSQRLELLNSEIFDRAGIEPDNLPHICDFFAEFGAGNLSEKSINLLREINRTVEARHGAQVTDIDIFSNHPDLKTRVENLELSEQDAREQLRYREQNSYRDTVTAQQNQQRAAEEQHKVKVSSSMDSIEKLRQQYQTSDPDWEAKEKLIVSRIEQRFPEIDPSQWVSAFQNIYEDVTEGIRTASAQFKQNRDTNTLTNNGISNVSDSVELTEDNYVDQFFAQKEA